MKYVEFDAVCGIMSEIGAFAVGCLYWLLWVVWQNIIRLELCWIVVSRFWATVGGAVILIWILTAHNANFGAKQNKKVKQKKL